MSVYSQIHDNPGQRAVTCCAESVVYALHGNGGGGEGTLYLFEVSLCRLFNVSIPEASKSMKQQMIGR